jgi:hypothetical protein
MHMVLHNELRTGAEFFTPAQPRTYRIDVILDIVTHLAGTAKMAG